MVCHFFCFIGLGSAHPRFLKAAEPKIVNGPEVLNKYVGQAEENIRNLFADAEKDEKTLGENSPLHVVIFDEIDSICKSRGSTRDGTGVHDSIVNQLLSKIDGVDSLNNILLIGMTNRNWLGLEYFWFSIVAYGIIIPTDFHIFPRGR